MAHFMAQTVDMLREGGGAVILLSTQSDFSPNAFSRLVFYKTHCLRGRFEFPKYQLPLE